MKKFITIFLKLLKYIIILAAISYIFFNATARKLISGYIKIHSLKSDIIKEQKINSDYKKRLYYLETKPEYMDRIVKDELNVLAEDEIEYRFEKE